jgi:hypothetical protein
MVIFDKEDILVEEDIIAKRTAKHINPPTLRPGARGAPLEGRSAT